MNYESLFSQLHPDFFSPGHLDYLDDEDAYEELVLNSGDKDFVKTEVPVTSDILDSDVRSEVTFGFINTSDENMMSRLQSAVAAVDEDWIQYFKNKSASYFCGFSGGEIASFCITGGMGRCEWEGKTLKIGGPGCVGTVPEYRRRGIGLRMVQLATEIPF